MAKVRYCELYEKKIEDLGERSCEECMEIYGNCFDFDPPECECFKMIEEEDIEE